ncbi:MAG: VWA domain-containing protein [Pirellulales bacterium]|nr:VWA domain-containing protein [Pirellulales bacterium]
MTPPCPSLFAQAAQGVVRTRFEWGRIQENSDWILPVGVCVGIMFYVRAMYRRDAAELHPMLSWLLTALRTATFLGLLILYLQPQWRAERETICNSRAVLLVDTSLSMGLSDDDPSTDGRSRIRRTAASLADTDFLTRLRRTHDVTVLRFNEDLDRNRVALGRRVPSDQTGTDRKDTWNAVAAEDTASTNDRLIETPVDDTPVDWTEFLNPGGAETRLGMALRQVINDEDGTPLSGIVLISDGGQNAGMGPESAVALARQAKVPVFPVGVGSDKQPVNVRVSDLTAPARAYPGDRYVVTGFIQAQGLAGQVVDVQLLSRKATGGAATSVAGSGRLEDRQQVILGADGEALPVEFGLTPEGTDRRTLVFRVDAPPGDRNTNDNFLEADVEIVDRKNRVLMLAGGPTREYRFLRTLLYRDRSATLDVLLQTAQPGMSQEADKILDDFPATREEMFQYDCVLAFDPDWQALTITQIDLLEQWVAEQGGGLIVIAGPVYTGTMVGGWVEDPAMAKVRALYPVEFHRRFSVLEDRVNVSEEAWPLQFTREGLEAEFLWLEDDATSGRQAWAGFQGVFSYCPVRGPKPGATVLAQFSDPRTGRSGEQPVYFASQFYGSGRVFYLGSGEMWRLRQVDATYFEKLYTKLIRHVSQGRLLRGSSRGVLLVGQDRYLLGNTVEVRTQLTDARMGPLEIPQVNLQVAGPEGAVQNVALQSDPSRTGTFTGRFVVLQEGTYRLELPVPESDDEILTRRIRVRVPDLEREDPRRNDALLTQIAQGTGGRYYVGLEALAAADDESLVEQLKDRTRIEVLPVAPSNDWEEDWLRWMMIVLCGLLCSEWLIRRLAKLA